MNRRRQQQRTTIAVPDGGKTQESDAVAAASLHGPMQQRATPPQRHDAAADAVAASPGQQCSAGGSHAGVQQGARGLGAWPVRSRSAAASAGAAAARAWGTQMLWPALILLSCAAWLSASSGAILLNKRIMVDLNFPYPGIVGGIGLCGTALISGVAARALRLHQQQQPRGGGGGGPAGAPLVITPRFYITSILPAGLCLALSMHLGNTAYLYLSVAFIQMLKAFTPVVTLLCAYAFGLERPSAPLTLSVTLIAAGVAVASWGEGSLSAVGLAAMAGSLVCEGLRLVLTQLLLARRAMHPLLTLALVAPAAAAWMAAISWAGEFAALRRQDPPSALWAHPHLLAGSALAGFCVNSMALAVITLTGALTLKCLGMAKDVGLVAYGVALGEAVSATQAAGYSISLAGFAAYNALKLGLLPAALGGGGAPAGAPAATQKGSGGGAAGRTAPEAAAGLGGAAAAATAAAAAAAMVAAAAAAGAADCGSRGAAAGKLRSRRPGKAACVADVDAAPVATVDAGM